MSGRVSSFCSGGDCVQVQLIADVVLVNSTVEGTPRIGFTTAEWEAFVAGVKLGEFDLEALRR